MSWCKKCVRKGTDFCRGCLGSYDINGNENIPSNFKAIEEMETLPILEDEINQPQHYHKGGLDVIGFAELHYSKEELKGFYRINCIKYIDRYEKKGGLKDLKKCEFYLKKLMELEEQR